MMKSFYEFTAIYIGAYTPEQTKEFSATHGDDRNDWPDTELRGRVTIDLYAVVGFNEVTRDTNVKMKGKTNVILIDGTSYLFDIKYESFDEIIKHAINNVFLQ